jgi:hypothetical protein
MSALFRNFLLSSFFVPFAIFMIATSGCQSSSEANRVDPNLAKSTLESALDGWQRGEPIASYQKNDAPVVVQDLDWTEGAKLTAYKILDSRDPLDANMFCRVQLSLEDVSGKRSEREVTYVVGTSPVRTVFRSLSP